MSHLRMICYLVVSLLLFSSIQTSSACTVITSTYSTGNYFGYNEDRILTQFDQSTTLSFFPEDEGTFGYMAIIAESSTVWSLRTGINSHGLAVSGNGIDAVHMNQHPDLTYDWKTHVYYRVVLEKCKTVEEAIQIARNFNFNPTMQAQFHIADALGNAVIISPQEDGEMGFYQIDSQYLVSTNENRGNIEAGGYDTRNNFLTHKIDDYETIGKSEMLEILDVAHQDNDEAVTYYSVLFDLSNLIIYLYLCHDFSTEVEFQLMDELSSEYHDYALEDLFEDGYEILSQAERTMILKQSIFTGLRVLTLSLIGLLLVYRIVVIRRQRKMTLKSSKRIIIGNLSNFFLWSIFMLINVALLPPLFMGELANALVKSGVLTPEVSVLLIAWLVFIANITLRLPRHKEEDNPRVIT